VHASPDQHLTALWQEGSTDANNAGARTPCSMVSTSRIPS
jgi:hypothetical protein